MAEEMEHIKDELVETIALELYREEGNAVPHVFASNFADEIIKRASSGKVKKSDIVGANSYSVLDNVLQSIRDSGYNRVSLKMDETGKLLFINNTGYHVRPEERIQII